MRYHVKFVKSAVAPQHFPSPGPPEIAFLGRSNVGKSSLINSLLGAKHAFVSSTPGRTQAINFFALRSKPEQHEPEMLFADLPGYGYARVPKAITAEWPKFIEPYLKQRPSLALAVAMVDSNIPPQESDLSLVAWLQQHHKPYLLVATKTDRLSGNKLRAAMQQLQKAFETEHVLPFSAKTRAGHKELWQAIRQAVSS